MTPARPVFAVAGSLMAFVLFAVAGGLFDWPPVLTGLFAVGAIVLPACAWLALSPRARFKPRGRLSKETRTSGALGAGIVGLVFSVLGIARMVHGGSGAPVGGVALFYFGVVWVALGAWMARLPVTSDG